MILDLVSQAFSLGCRNRALQAQNSDATTYCFATKKVDDLCEGGEKNPSCGFALVRLQPDDEA
jgi:hypothetical protein